MTNVLVYSDDAHTRARVLFALGRRPFPALGEFTYVEVATASLVLDHVAAGRLDLLILDGEAAPAGGIGLAKQIKDEHPDAPPVVVLTGREQDAWLSTWARAEATVVQPYAPLDLVAAVKPLLAA